jgi:Kelch motif
MLRLCKNHRLRLALVVLLAASPGAVLAAGASASSPAADRVTGTWRTLPTAPIAVFPATSVWTGRQLIVVGRRPFTSIDVAETYAPATRTWTRLTPPRGPRYSPGYKAVWTGKEMLSWGPFHSFALNPLTNRWRPLRHSLPTGIVVWTGREAIGWGGGCCGDAQSNGAAYDPATNRYRQLPRSPLAPSQGPVGAWTGRELVLLVSGLDPDGKPYPARFARAAAYNPTTNTWRRIAPAPEAGGSAVWDGRELLVAGAGADARAAFAYRPATNRWRRLASLPAGRVGGTAVWSGRQLYLWGGQSRGGLKSLRDGIAYDPRTNRWSAIPQAPLRRGVGGSTVVWTGRGLLVWGGEIGTPAGTSLPPRFPRGGATFTPSTR